MHAGPDLFGGDPFLGSMLGPGDFTGAGGLGGGLGGFSGGAGLGGELSCIVICVGTCTSVNIQHTTLPAIILP
jgi:hypothetical protein